MDLCARAECRSCFDHADFSAENIACGLSSKSMKRRAGDGRRRTIINTARIEVPFMWGSLRLAPITEIITIILITSHDKFYRVPVLPLRGYRP